VSAIAWTVLVRGDRAARCRLRKRVVVPARRCMASLDIAERRLPQDGRIKMKIGKGREMELPRLRLPRSTARKIVSGSSTSRTWSST